MAIINQVVSGGSSPTPTGKYQLLQRVTDDNNNEIGTVCGFHTDANDVEYAVVCLDAQYRLAAGQYLSQKQSVTSLSYLNNETLWENTDTATSNCTKILDFVTAKGYTSTAVSHCRSKSFVIGGITYYGQLPTIVELSDIFRNRTAINSMDTTASQYSSLVVPTATNCWSSSQYNDQNGWSITRYGLAGVNYKDDNEFSIPVLELPNA